MLDKNKPIVGETYEGQGVFKPYPVQDFLAPGTLIKISNTGYAENTVAGTDEVYGVAGWGRNDSFLGKIQNIIIEGLAVASVDPTGMTGARRVLKEQQIDAQLDNGDSVVGYILRIG